MATKPEIKKILLDLIYTPDAKPRFVGGDVSSKLQRIDDAVDDLFEAFKPKAVDIAYEILCTDDVDIDGDALTLEQMIEAIQKQDEVDGSQLIDYVDGVSVWEKMEYEFTCNDFLIYIGLKEK